MFCKAETKRKSMGTLPLYLGSIMVSNFENQMLVKYRIQSFQLDREYSAHPKIKKKNDFLIPFVLLYPKKYLLIQDTNFGEKQMNI